MLKGTFKFLLTFLSDTWQNFNIVNQSTVDKKDYQFSILTDKN